MFEYSQSQGCSGTIREVHFIDKDQAIVQLIQSSFTKLFRAGPPSIPKSSNLSRTVKSSSSNLSKSVRAGRSFSRSMSREPKVYTHGDVKIYVQGGNITAIGVDGIICSQDQECTGRGQIAKNLYKNSGEKYKQALSKAMENRPLMYKTRIVDTHGELSARYVIHAVPPRWSQYKDRDYFMKCMTKVVEAIFDDVQNTRLQSIAIPLLGIGNYFRT